MNKNRYISIVVFLLIVTGLTSCLGLICINGNGIFVTVERPETGFQGIANSTSANVYFSKGDGFSIFIEADENIVQYIHTSVSSGLLEIEIKGTGCIRPQRTPVVYVTAPTLSEIYSSGSGDIFADTLMGNEITISDSGSGNIISNFIDASDITIRNSGSGDISISELYAGELLIKISGSGDVSAEGDAETTDIVSSGSGQTYCQDLSTDLCNVLISASGNVHINVLQELIATLTGSGNLYYSGDPEIHENVTGSGQVVRVNK